MAVRMLGKEERSRVRVVQVDNLRGLLGNRRMDSPECTDKGVVLSDERIDGVLRFGRKDRMKNKIRLRRESVGKWSVSCSVGRPRKRWIDTVRTV